MELIPYVDPKTRKILLMEEEYDKTNNLTDIKQYDINYHNYHLYKLLLEYNVLPENRYNIITQLKQHLTQDPIEKIVNTEIPLINNNKCPICGSNVLFIDNEPYCTYIDCQFSYNIVSSYYLINKLGNENYYISEKTYEKQLNILQWIKDHFGNKNDFITEESIRSIVKQTITLLEPNIVYMIQADVLQYEYVPLYYSLTTPFSLLSILTFLPYLYNAENDIIDKKEKTLYEKLHGKLSELLNNIELYTLLALSSPTNIETQNKVINPDIIKDFILVNQNSLDTVMTDMSIYGNNLFHMLFLSFMLRFPDKYNITELYNTLMFILHILNVNYLSFYRTISKKPIPSYIKKNPNDDYIISKNLEMLNTIYYKH